MQKDNAVIFKGGKNGIIIILDANATIGQISDALRRKIRGASSFFADATTTISFKGKAISEAEILSLIEIITSETDLSIRYVEDLTDGSNLKINPPEDILTNEAPLSAYIHKAGLRSGQAIHHNGCVTVLGDINGGAEVVATGNVMVFGAVRGMVHAGSGGDTSAFVCALSLQPTQLRIADIITYFPKEVMNSKNKIDPVYAFVQDDEIYISPITN